MFSMFYATRNICWSTTKRWSRYCFIWKKCFKAVKGRESCVEKLKVEISVLQEMIDKGETNIGNQFISILGMVQLIRTDVSPQHPHFAGG